MKTNVLSQQSLFDIAVQALGTADAAFELAFENDRSLVDDLSVQDILSYPDGGFRNTSIASYYKNKGIFPATGFLGDLPYDGINYMNIEYDFLVSKGEKI